MNYKLAPGLVFPTNLKNKIKSLDWSTLPLAYRADRLVFLKEFIRAKKYTSLSAIRGFQKCYGFFAQNVGTIDNYHLPEDLLSQVQNHYSQFFDHLDEQPIIRLQIVHGGNLIPLHIDLTRSTSLIVPISHLAPARTNFYTSPDAPTSRGMVDPTNCQLTNSIIIDRIPALLDVDQIHAVTYDKHTLTRESPRISINLKWSSTKFSTIAKCLKGKQHGILR